MRFKIHWANLIVGSNFTGQLSKYKLPGGLYLEGRLNGGFFVLRVWGLFLEGLLHGGAYFRNFTVCNCFQAGVALVR